MRRLSFDLIGLPPTPTEISAFRSAWNKNPDTAIKAKVNELLALPDWVVPVAGLALGYPEAKEPLSVRLSLSATVHTDRYDTRLVERELEAYDARRGKDWTGGKVKQYSEVMRADFGAFVAKKRYRLT